MGRAALSRGGLAAVLVLLGLYVLLGGEIDLGGSDSSSSSTTTEARAPSAEISQQEAPAAL